MGLFVVCLIIKFYFYFHQKNFNIFCLSITIFCTPSPNIHIILTQQYYTCQQRYICSIFFIVYLSWKNTQKNICFWIFKTKIYSFSKIWLCRNLTKVCLVGTRGLNIHPEWMSHWRLWLIDLLVLVGCVLLVYNGMGILI